MEKDRVCLDFDYLVNTAQGNLKKAKFFRKCCLFDQELHFLKRFEALTSSSIPVHPDYTGNKGKKFVKNIEGNVSPSRNRIQELEKRSHRDEPESLPEVQYERRSLRPGILRFSSRSRFKTREEPRMERERPTGKQNLKYLENHDTEAIKGTLSGSLDNAPNTLEKLHKKLLGGSSERLINEFRLTLKTLGNVAEKQPDDFRELEGSSVNDCKVHEADFIQNFISSTRSFLNAEAKSCRKVGLEQMEGASQVEDNVLQKDIHRSECMKQLEFQDNKDKLDSVVVRAFVFICKEMDGILRLKSEGKNLKEVMENTFSRLESDMKCQARGIRKLEELTLRNRDSVKKLFQILERDKDAHRDELENVRKDQDIISRAVDMQTVHKIGLVEAKKEVSSLKNSQDFMARADSLLAEMRNRRNKCMQLESIMTNATEAAMKWQETFCLELREAKNSWNLAMNTKIDEANAMIGELKEQSKYLLSTMEDPNAFAGRMQRLENNVRELIAAMTSTVGGSTVFEDITAVQKEICRMDEQIQTALEKINKKSRNLPASVDSNSVKSQKQIGIDIVGVIKKMRKLGKTQWNLVDSVKELWTNASDFKISMSSWLAKYETAAQAMKNVDARLGAAEVAIKEIEDQYGLDIQQKYASLVNRIDTFTSETTHDISNLNGKVDKCIAGVNSAIEGATHAERKCGVLGQEIVKVFRMFAAQNGKLCIERTLPSETSKPDLVGREPCKQMIIDSSLSQVTSSKERNLGTKGAYYSGFIESYARAHYENGREKIKNGFDLVGNDTASQFSGKNKMKNYSCHRTCIRLQSGT